MKLNVGQQAPPFELPNTDKQFKKLSDYQGQNVLIVFFPMAFTSVCTDELCTLRDEFKVYEDLDTTILAISVDSPFTLGKFKEIQGYNYEFLSDFNKTTAQAYGALYQNFVLGLQGVAKRSAFVVDKAGTIQYAEVLENAGDLPNFEAVKETLQGLK